MSAMLAIIAATPQHLDGFSLDQILDKLANDTEAAKVIAPKIAERAAPNGSKAGAFARLLPDAHENGMRGR